MMFQHDKRKVKNEEVQPSNIKETVIKGLFQLIVAILGVLGGGSALVFVISGGDVNVFNNLWQVIINEGETVTIVTATPYADDDTLTVVPTDIYEDPPRETPTHNSNGEDEPTATPTSTAETVPQPQSANFSSGQLLQISNGAGAWLRQTPDSGTVIFSGLNYSDYVLVLNSTPHYTTDWWWEVRTIDNDYRGWVEEYSLQTTSNVIIVAEASDVNIRYGDSTQYDIVGGLRQGQYLQATGISNRGTGWYQVATSNSSQGWMSPSVVTAYGNTNTLPLIAPPALPPTAIPPSATPRIVTPTTIPIPVASFSATQTSGQAPVTIQFTNTSVGNVTSYTWNFGDGTTSNSPNPSHTYTSAGTYTVMLTVSGAGGSNSTTRTVTVTTSLADQYTGMWYNTNSNTRSITRMEIWFSGNTPYMHWWGACSPSDCDNGIHSGSWNGSALVFTPIYSFVEMRFDVRLNGSTLSVTSFSHFIDNSGRADYSVSESFYK